MKRVPLLVALTLGLAPLAAPAVVPSAQRLTEAVASRNAKGGRVHALRVEVVLRRSPDGGVEATGVAWLDPSGAARLELRGDDGTLETHRLRDGVHSAERDGLGLPAPRPLLAPWRLLQAETAGELRGALLGLGVDVDRVDLGLEGDHDCYVLGGREPALERRRPPSRAALWVDVETLEPVRVDRGDGVRFRFGPARGEGALRFPSFVEVESPHGGRWRLEVRRVGRGSLPAAPL